MDDWRLNGQEDYLFGITLTRKKFESCGYYDHAHCDFCWAKISDCCEGALEFGYCSSGETHWICETCYKDFKDLFKFKLSET